MTDRRLLPQSGITRRGLLVGAGLIAAPFVVRSRSASVKPVPVPANRSYPRADILISPNALYQQIIVDRQAIRLLDATTLATYRERHIPGAVHVWWQDTMELNAPYYGMVLKPDDDQGNQHRRIRFLERLGISDGDVVVVYGDGEDPSSTRVCWFLRFLGIPARILEGGRAGWLEIAGPMSDEAPEVSESTSPQIHPQQDYYLFAEQVATRLSGPGVQLIDLRNAEERTSGPYRNLRIPGAIDVPRSDLRDENDLLLPATELRQIFSDAGIDLTANLMLIGPTGLDAAVPWLAFSLLGADPVIIADGGWQEWVDQPELPLGR